jgi:hypothetical protein
MFYIHPSIQSARVNILDEDFPGLQGFTANNYGQKNGTNLDLEQVTDLALYSCCRRNFL